MSYDVYRYIFIGAAVMCGVMLVVSIILFIVLKIPKVIGDLSGATARKAIKNIREQNEASGDKAYKASAYNAARGRLTDKITPSGRVVQNQVAQGYGGHGTTKIATQQLVDNEGGNETTVLEASNQTTVLDASNATTLLSDRTVNLDTQNTEAVATSILASAGKTGLFVIEYEITYIHSNQIIDGGALG